MIDIFDQAQEELQSEENARYDSVRERFAATELDPYYEAFCDPDVPEDMTFAEFKAQVKAAERAERFVPVVEVGDRDEDDPVPF